MCVIKQNGLINSDFYSSCKNTPSVRKSCETCWIHIAEQLEVRQEIISTKRPKCFSDRAWHLTSAKMGWTSHLALHWTKTVGTICKCYLTLMGSAAQFGVHHPQLHVIASKIYYLWAGGPLLLGVRRWLTECVLGSRRCKGAWVSFVAAHTCVRVCVSSDDVMSVCTFELFSSNVDVLEAKQ